MIWGFEPSPSLGGEDPVASCQDARPDTDVSEESALLHILSMCFGLNQGWGEREDWATGGKIHFAELQLLWNSNFWTSEQAKILVFFKHVYSRQSRTSGLGKKHLWVLRSPKASWDIKYLLHKITQWWFKAGGTGNERIKWPLKYT